MVAVHASVEIGTLGADRRRPTDGKGQHEQQAIADDGEDGARADRQGTARAQAREEAGCCGRAQGEGGRGRPAAGAGRRRLEAERGIGHALSSIRVGSNGIVRRSSARLVLRSSESGFAPATRQYPNSASGVSASPSRMSAKSGTLPGRIGKSLRYARSLSNRNVAFSKPDATEEEILHACRVARVDEPIAPLQKRFLRCGLQGKLARLIEDGAHRGYGRVFFEITLRTEVAREIEGKIRAMVAGGDAAVPVEGIEEAE